MRIFVLISMYIIMLTSSTFGFDNQRKGFVFGGGLGIAPISQFKIGNTSENNIALAGNVIIGYGLDNQNILALEINSSYRNSDYYSEIGNRTINAWWFAEGPLHGDQTIFQGFNGITWYHYFSPLEKSWFSVIGIGGYHLQTKSLGNNDFGFGYMIGGGYKLTQNIQIGGYYTTGQSNEHGYVDFNHNQLSVIVSYIKF